MAALAAAVEPASTAPAPTVTNVAPQGAAGLLHPSAADSHRAPGGIDASGTEAPTGDLGAASVVRWPGLAPLIGRLGRPVPLIGGLGGSVPLVAEDVPGWLPFGRVTALGPPHPFWYGEATAVGLKRDAEPDGGPIATLNTPLGTVLESAEAFPDFRAGGIARVGRMFTPMCGIEFGYLGTGRWQGDAAVRDQTDNALDGLGNLFSPFGGFGETPVEDFDYNELVSIHGESRIQSFELSLRQRLIMPIEPLQVSVLYGIRYLDLGERFTYYSQSQVPLPTGATQFADVRTQNDLFGGQLAALLEWHSDPRWWVDLRLAIALLNNRASQTTIHVETGDHPGVNVLRRANERGTVAAEISLGFVYYVRSHLSTRFGYHFLWLDRVALAAENLGTDPGVLRSGPAQLNAKGTIMYHGPFLGVALEW